MTAQRQTDSLLPSGEASEEQIQLALEQGHALRHAIEEMTAREADWGELQRAGDYVVGVAVEHAEGMWVLEDGALEWHLPEHDNAHLEVVVCDARDGRFVPGLDVSLRLTTAEGDEVDDHRQPFVWHPWLPHYGRNWEVPGDGTYTARVVIEPAGFHRHDARNGRRFADRVEVCFEGVEIECGQKREEP